MEPRTLSGLPRAVVFAVGVAAIVAGASLTLQPFSTLRALTWFVGVSLVLAGAGDLLGGRLSGSLGDRLPGSLLAVTGLVVALAPGLNVRGVAIVVGVGVCLTGLARLTAGWRGDVEERYSAVVGGLAGAVFGALALVWPDVTILVVALLVGPVAIVYGARQALWAIRGSTSGALTATSRALVWLRALRATGALLLALLLVLVSALVHHASASIPAFYSWSGPLPARPGVLLRQERVTQGIPGDARAYRILYTTTGLRGGITTASGLVAVPRASAGRRALPVVLWEHGTTGVARDCAPSILRRPLSGGGLDFAAQLLSRGWVIVAPDYLGLGASPPHPYLVGVPEARSSLDAVRAARQLRIVSLSDRTVVWGHSQGGGAALWTGIVQPTYAPGVPLRGVAALAPASDLVRLVGTVQSTSGGSYFGALIVAGYSNAYRNVSFNAYIAPGVRAVVRSIVGRCLNQPVSLLSLPALLTGEPLFSRSLLTGPLGARLAENVPSEATRTPTLIAQGEADTLVLPRVQRAFVRRLCGEGEALEYRTYPGRSHVSLVQRGSPLIPYLLNWTAARFRGGRAPSNC